jgi:hypothetical protein
MFKLSEIPWPALGKAAAALILIAFAVSTCSGLREFEAEISEMEGVQIGDSRAEVLYRLGYPPRVLGEVTSFKVGEESIETQAVYWLSNPPTPGNAMPKGATVQEFAGWSYPNSRGAEVTVQFDETDKVSAIECTSMQRQSWACGPVAGVWVNDREEVVLRLGEPSRIRLRGTTKLMAYDDIGVHFLLTKGRVYRITLVEPENHSIAAAGRYFERRFP